MLKKFDPMINRHVLFTESKMQSGKNRWYKSNILILNFIEKLLYFQTLIDYKHLMDFKNVYILLN